MNTTTYRCQNCDFHTHDADSLEPVRDLEQRVSPGEAVPFGECPECGAVVHAEESEVAAAAESAAALLARAMKAGLSFGECVRAFGVDADDPVVAEARRIYGSDDVEIDDRAVTSEGSDGAWVSAWVWVPVPETDNLAD